jgi:hypothetical protein
MAEGSELEARVTALETRFDRVERRVEDGFMQVQDKLDELAAGQQQIVGLLNTLIDQPGESG